MLDLLLFLVNEMIRSEGGHELLIFLRFHSAILEPDLDLSLAQGEDVSDFDSSSASQVAIEVELLLQFECLVTSVCLAGSLGS